MINSHSMDFYHAAIKSVDADASDIRQPAVRGKMATVFFADLPDRTKVYRFSEYSFIRRNKKLSYLLSLCDVPAPRINTHCYMRTWFETYDYVPDKTMYEHNVARPLSDQEKFTIYQELMRIEFAISKISMADVGNIAYKHFSQIYSARHSIKYPKPIAVAMNTMMYTMSRTGKMRLFHNDPTPGNILLTPDRHVSYMLDLDGICVSNSYFALMKILQYCPDYMWSDLLQYYGVISRRRPPKGLILNTMKMLCTIMPQWTQYTIRQNDTTR